MSGDRYSDRRGRGQPGSREQGGPPARRTLDEVWPGYLDGGYFDEAGELKPDYVVRAKVEPLVSEMAKRIRGLESSDPHLTTNQLRRFFQHCRAIEARLKSKEAEWRAVEADFRKLDVAVADAHGKSQKKVPKLFHDFIQRNVAKVRNENDFLKGFLPHFEALVGFGAKHLEKERN